MGMIKIVLHSPAARANYGVKSATDVVEVDENNETVKMYLGCGVAQRVTATGKPAKRTTKKARGGVERATK